VSFGGAARKENWANPREPKEWEKWVMRACNCPQGSWEGKREEKTRGERHAGGLHTKKKTLWLKAASPSGGSRGK